MNCDAGFSGGDYDDCDEMAQMFDSRAVKRTRKDHRCEECKAVIPAGSTNIRNYTGLMEGKWFSLYVCSPCEEIYDAFKSEGDGTVIFGTLWQNMRDQAFPDLTTACFDKLQTAEAKKKLRDRWMKWKGLAAA